MSQDRKYLIQRKDRDVWLFSKRIPKHLQHLYGGKEVYTESLKTDSLKIARQKRDILLAKLRLQEGQAYDGSRETFSAFYNSLANAKKTHGQHPNDAYHQLDLEDLLDTTKHPEIQRDARLAVESGIIPVKYTHSLRESLADWLNRNGHRHSDTLSKSKSTVDRFLKFSGVFDTPLLEIDRSTVVGFIEDLASEGLSASTIRTHLSRLRTVYKHAWDMGFIKQKENPFEDHSLAHLETNKVVKQRDLFTREQIQKMASWAEGETARGSSYGLLFRLGLFTGCRIGELCALKAGDVYQDSGITAIRVVKGKTDAARRSVPLTDELAEEINQVIKDKAPNESLLGLNKESAIRKFSDFKTKSITKDKSRTFHSLRVHASTAYLRAGVPEERSAFIIGHSGGKTMTYGYYAKGDELSQLKKYVDEAEKVIMRDWL